MPSPPQIVLASTHPPIPTLAELHLLSPRQLLSLVDRQDNIPKHRKRYFKHILRARISPIEITCQRCLVNERICARAPEKGSSSNRAASLDCTECMWEGKGCEISVGLKGIKGAWSHPCSVEDKRVSALIDGFDWNTDGREQSAKEKEVVILRLREALGILDGISSKPEAGKNTCPDLLSRSS